MPARLIPLITGQYYHIFNRGVARQPIFQEKRDYARFIATLDYYRYYPLPTRFSKLQLLANSIRKILLKELQKSGNLQAEIISYVCMPNHYHLLLKQTRDNGISKYLKELQNSYTRYFNTKHKRIGTLFQGQFKAIRIESEEQLLHLSRYIHLNPYTSYVVKNVNDLKIYPWSSLHQYLNTSQGFAQTDVIKSSFSTPSKYWKFIEDQAEYQRELNLINHLLLEE